METFTLDLTKIKRFQIVGRTLRFSVVAAEEDTSLPSLMVSTCMDPIDVQPASTLCPYGMYVCVCVCVYVCMYVWMEGWMDGWTDVCM